MFNVDSTKYDLTVDVTRNIYQPKHVSIVIRHELGNVIMFIDGKRVEMTTITAHGIGMAIAKAVPQLEQGEIIEVNINKEPIQLIGGYAMKVAGALLRKADDADDWQLQHNTKRILQ